jgi:fatty-acyl-CoA synthase
MPINYDEVEMNWVGDWVGRRALITPKRIGVYDAGSDYRLTYAQLNERANRVGAYLVDALKLKKGDVISFLSRNRIEPIDLYFAAGKIGLILAPLSYRLAKPELDDLLHRIQPKVFFAEDFFSSLLDSLTLPKSVQRTIVFGDSHSAYEQEVLATPPRDVNRPLALNDLFLYVHTGGTTATPKVCKVTHRQMLWNSFDLIATGSAGTGIGGKELVTFPFFHIGGWNTVTPLFHIGGQIVLMREFNPDIALDLIEKEQITHFGGVEAMFRFMIACPKFKTTSFKSVLYINSAGAPCAAEVMNAFWEKGIALTQSYGLTEAGPSNFILLPDGHSMEEIKSYSHSIGFPMYHCDARIIDPATQHEVPPGRVGELCFLSPHNFDGYLHDPERTQKIVDAQGWVHSGDLATRDELGYVRIVGRADNMFISGGENVSPEEIEQALLQHPAVSQVGVVGVLDAQWGQVALAVVVLKQDFSVSEEELKYFCQTRIARFKLPKHIRFTKALPLTGAGKVDRKALREKL